MKIGIIPARAGSKGIPGKNTMRCAGKPLVDWTIEAANNSMLDYTILSSDSPEILEHATGRVLPLRRPDEAADDHATQEQVIAHVMQTITPTDDDIFVLLQPTSPQRKAIDINSAVSLLLEREYIAADSIVSVVMGVPFTWAYNEDSSVFIGSYVPKLRPNRQDMKAIFRENGSLYVFTNHVWQTEHCRLGGTIRPYLMTEEHAIEIDTYFDFFLVEQILSGYQNPHLDQFK